MQNEREVGLATALVEDLGTVDDFEDRVKALLVPAFRGWADGGKLEELEAGIVRVEIPRRLRRLLGRDTVSRATYRRDIAVRESDEDRNDPAELLSPGHPLVEAVAQALREESMDSRFDHRFDVAADSAPALVLSFLARYGDAEGRTVEERIEAVAVEIDGSVSSNPEIDLGRLALDGQPGDIGPAARPDPAAIVAWQQEYERLVPLARREAESRAAGHVYELTEMSRRIYEEELAALALWKRDQEERIDADTIGLSAQISFETAEAFQHRRAELDAAYERRVDALRDQSTIELTSVDLIGGLLLVSPAP